MKIPGECRLCGGQNGNHASWCGRARGCGGAKSNGNSFGPDRVKRSWELAMLDEAQVTFWKLI